MKLGTTVAAALSIPLCAQLAIGTLVPVPNHVPKLASRLASGSRLSRRDTNYLHGYNGTTNSSVVQFPLSTDDEYSFILTEALALANGGGSATSEILRAASQIVPRDGDSFFNEFYWLAQQIHARALAAKTKTSAREAYFRASTYYRMSNFFLTGNWSDPRLYGPWEQALEDFRMAISLQDIPGEHFTIAGPGFQIPGYFWKAKSNNLTKVPTVIVGSGYDGAQEDSWHQLGQEVLDRGWNYVVYEGPGQPTVRRQQGVGFIPDWWSAVMPLVDFLISRPDVDESNLALVGVSLGGLLAPIAATHEHRFKAVLSIDGATSFQQAILSEMGPLAKVFEAGNATAFDEIMSRVMPELSTSGAWGMTQGLWTFNTHSYFDFVNRTGAFDLTPANVGNITGYPWVGKGQNDTTLGGQELGEVALYDKYAKHNATFHYFPSNIGAGLHCQIGAEPLLAEAALDWLDGIFKL